MTTARMRNLRGTSGGTGVACTVYVQCSVPHACPDTRRPCAMEAAREHLNDVSNSRNPWT
jgi:hypothetical protein